MKKVARNFLTTQRKNEQRAWTPSRALSIIQISINVTRPPLLLKVKDLALAGQAASSSVLDTVTRALAEKC